jgi:hypothetical protein
MTLKNDLVNRLRAYLLSADSFSAEDIPRDFRVVFPFNERNGAAGWLATGVLPGVQGISDSGFLIVDDFLYEDNRDAILVMPGMEVVRQNHLSRVMYKNPDYMVSKNFDAWKRAADVKSTSSMLYFIIEHLQETEAIPTKLKMPQVVKYLKGNPLNINNMNDLTIYIKDMVEASVLGSVDHAVLKTEIIDYTLNAMNAYSPEGEWRLKDTTLRIPLGSKLFLTKGSLDQEIAVAEYELDRYYRIFWINQERWDAIEKQRAASYEKGSDLRRVTQS